MTTDIAAPHAHHWVIEAPKAAKSSGVCRICGQQRRFKNAPEPYRDRNNRDTDIALVASSVPRGEIRLSDDV